MQPDVKQRIISKKHTQSVLSSYARGIYYRKTQNIIFHL